MSRPLQYYVGEGSLWDMDEEDEHANTHMCTHTFVNKHFGLEGTEDPDWAQKRFTVKKVIKVQPRSWGHKAISPLAPAGWGGDTLLAASTDS